nr:unnamed protein product [Callosobruchus analis]
MEARGRGRARGRARGGQQGGPGAPQGPRPGPQQPQPPHQQAPGPQQTWSRPPMPQQGIPPQQQQWVRPQMQTAPPPSAGRGTRMGGGEPSDVTPSQEAVGAVGGQGDGADTQARGGGNGVRGRGGAFRSEIIRTKPKNMESKQGSSGTPIHLTANYFSLLQAGKWGLNQYQVDFNPAVDQTRDRKRLLREALQDVGINGYLFDGTNMYTPQRLHPDPLDKFVQNEGENIRVTVRLVGDVSWGDRHYIQLFNIIIRKCLTFMKFQLVGRDYYDPNSKIAVHEHKLELWPGYFTSIRQHENNILMACDVTFKVMRRDNCYDMLLGCQSPNPQREFQQQIIGSIVMASYSNKTYRIDDVDFNTTPQHSFKMKDGSECTYMDYYAKRYNICIQVKNQPMLVSRSKPREIRAGMPETIYLVPELCQLTGLTDRQRDNFHLMRALADHTRIGPPQRIQKLKEFSDRCPEAIQELKRWDLKFSQDLVKFQGRVLPPETIVGGGNKKYSAGPQADWTRDLRSLPMFDPAQMSRLAVICPVKFKQSCSEFIQCLQRAARGMEWDIGQPKIFDINDDRSHTYLEKIEEIISKANPTMIMCISPNNSADRYSAIKKKCCVDRGVPTQVILAKNMSSKGGAPWTILMPLNNIMIVGYDVCRDTVKKEKSFAGMVASLNKQITRYFNFTSEHELQEELSDNFSSFLVLACHKFKELNGRYPERILIYRDGVGEGQLPYVFDQEIEMIKTKLTASVYKKPEDLRMAFVVVSKRINTRIFGDKGNPPPGTVIDDVVTLPERNASYSHYKVIVFNETWLTSDYHDSELNLYDYSIFRRDRSSLTSAHNRGDIEQLFVLVEVGATQYIIGTVYLPPGSSVDKYVVFSDNLESLYDEFPDCKLCIMGDFNLPNSLWSKEQFGSYATALASASHREVECLSMLSNMCSLHNLFQVNSVVNVNHSVLDLVFCQDLELSVLPADEALLEPDTHHPPLYDFFVISQCVKQGTVSPTSYNVLYDNMGLPPDRMQIMAYKLCHMYYNWSGTVRVPAPCQYAHKLAFLTAQSLHRPANRTLENVLYYL